MPRTIILDATSSRVAVGADVITAPPPIKTTIFFMDAITRYYSNQYVTPDPI